MIDEKILPRVNEDKVTCDIRCPSFYGLSGLYGTCTITGATVCLRQYCVVWYQRRAAAWKAAAKRRSAPVPEPRAKRAVKMVCPRDASFLYAIEGREDRAVCPDCGTRMESIDD
jgi:hypothetical protein